MLCRPAPATGNVRRRSRILVTSYAAFLPVAISYAFKGAAHGPAAMIVVRGRFGGRVVAPPPPSLCMANPYVLASEQPTGPMR